MSYSESQEEILLSSITTEIGIQLYRDQKIHSVGKIPSQGKKRLVPCAEKKYLKEALTHGDIVAVVVPQSLTNDVPDHLGIIESDNPIITAYEIHDFLCHRKAHYWTDFKTIISPSAKIDKNATISDMNVMIGDNTIIETGVVIKERSLIGADCTIGANVVIGGNAFEIIKKDNKQCLLPQAGGVKIGNNVIIQSCSNIDRASFTGFTTIEDEAALDSKVHIAHDCHIGKQAKITAGVTLAGRVKIANNAYLGPNCTISNGIHIGAFAKVSLGAVVVQDVAAEDVVSGNFAVKHRELLRFISRLKSKRL